MNRYFSQELVDAVHYINSVFKGNVIFCGSFGLVLNGKLKRFVKDIDVITLMSHHETRTSVGIDWTTGHRKIESPSASFTVGGERVVCEKFSIPNNLFKGDMIYRLTIPQYDLIDFEGVTIKLEKPEGAISAKISYVQSLTETEREKHFNDLKELGVDVEKVLLVRKVEAKANVIENLTL